MKERPIIFSAPMVRALLAGVKTQTRRIVKPQPTRVLDHMDGRIRIPDGWEWKDLYGADEGGHFADALKFHSPYGVIGSRLWVKETHQFAQMPNEMIVAYRASCENDSFTYADPNAGTIEELEIHKWKPAIFMRRLESRISLVVTGVRVERLHAITEADAWDEGIEAVDGELDNSAICRAAHFMACSAEDARATYGALWAEINGEQSLIDNPWVWVVDVKRVDEKQKAA